MCERVLVNCVTTLQAFCFCPEATDQISVYIIENENLNEDDRDRLRTQLLEDSIFLKMHRWKKESFVKDRQLYNEMIITRDQRQMRKEEAEGSVIETMINL